MIISKPSNKSYRNSKNSCYKILTSAQHIDHLQEESFSVLIICTQLIEVAVRDGCIFQIVGHDGV